MSKPESKAERQQRSDEQVAKLIKTQKRSGMSVAAFAREHGVPVWKLYQAARPKRGRRPKEFVEVAVTPKEADDPLPLEVLVPGGLRVIIPPHFDESVLRRLLGALSSC